MNWSQTRIGPCGHGRRKYRRMGTKFAFSRYLRSATVRVLTGNPADSDHVEASLERHHQTFQHPPEWYAGDRGFYSADNVQRFQQAEVGEVCIPQRGGKKTAEQEALE